MKVGSINHVIKAPKSPLAKKALCALQICSSTDILLVELEHHHTPRHLTDSTTGRTATEAEGSFPFLPVIAIPHFSVLNLRPFLSARGNSFNFFSCVIGISCGGANVVCVCKRTYEEPLNSEVQILGFQIS